MKEVLKYLKARQKHKPFRARIHVTVCHDGTVRRWRLGAEAETAAHLELTGPTYGDGSIELAKYTLKDDAVRAGMGVQRWWWSTDPGADTPSSLYIHGEDGEIKEERSYPKKLDPSPPVG